MNYPSGMDVQDASEQRMSEEAQQAGLPGAIDPTQVATGAPSSRSEIARNLVFSIEGLTAYYGDAAAISDVSFEIYQRMVTAIIGPSGCGKSTFIRCLNRMNDVIPGFRTDGRILYHDVDLQSGTSTRSQFAGGSEWSSSDRTRSRSRSTRTSPTACASSASRTN